MIEIADTFLTKEDIKTLYPMVKDCFESVTSPDEVEDFTQKNPPYTYRKPEKGLNRIKREILIQKMLKILRDKGEVE